MRFHILGSGTLVPHDQRGPAGFLLSHEGHNILIDGGSGTIQRLARLGVDARLLSGIVYTHRHIDHTGDLVPILFAMCVGIDIRRTDDLPIWAGEGFAPFLAGLQAHYGSWVTPSRFAIRLQSLPLDAPGEALLPGGIQLGTRPAFHEEGPLHLSFSVPGGPRVVLSGDTGPSDALVELARGADLLVCECANEDGSTYPHHLSPTQVAAIVDAARPARVVLTHFYPHSDRATALEKVSRTGVPTFLGEDCMFVPLGPDAD